MKLGRIYTLCITLLCFAAMHHCAFEQLAALFVNPQTTQEASQNGDPIQCPSHSQDDPNSHEEGQSCGTALQADASTKIQDPAQDLVPFSLALAGFLTNKLLFADTTLQAVQVAAVETSPVLTQLSHSLSIVPNAPPVALV